jgi:hypothetical protein
MRCLAIGELPLFQFAMAANLVRMPKLLATAGGRA